MDDRAAALLHWYDAHARALPWRIAPGSAERADPYRVWLSEVMLQQTTVAAVRPYFARFTARWPDVAALAAAPAEAVMADWAGLGYYSRARNLHACAQLVAALGAFPDTEAALRRLPGIGDYTAAAIAAIAFGRRAVVVDANVERVVARLANIATPLPQARPLIRAATDAITPATRAGDFAQGMMDLGATICLPRNPRCLLCPLADGCLARAEGRQEALPVKAPKKAKPQRKGAAFWIQRAGAVLLVQRPGTGLLGGMRALPDDGWSAAGDGSGIRPLAGDWRMLGVVRHGFTHFDLELTVHALTVSGAAPMDGAWVPLGEAEQAGLPTLFRKAVALGLDDAAADHQPQRGQHQHDQAEIASAVLARQGTDHRAGDRDRQDQPVAPAKEGDG
ncbi:A/G-specific adenine glycosylase [Croceibacterium mercuriale]|uniref:A/G-specific adenine glycosylase n=1 Tax=Croceibacterium mercuriale TaxID=1572751 RepID=UPI0009DD8511|nr:A/G-specific adenine glycosylase [Croceibacterium mercuriale]